MSFRRNKLHTFYAWSTRSAPWHPWTMDRVLNGVTQAWRSQRCVHVDDQVKQSSTRTVSWFWRRVVVKLKVLNNCNELVIHRIAVPHEARKRMLIIIAFSTPLEHWSN